jgi:hypothetical protein
MTCPRCTAPLPPNSLFCNRCGTKTNPNEAPANANSGRWLIIVAGAILVTGVMGSVLASGALDGYIFADENKPKPPSSGTTPTPSSSPSTKSPPSTGPKVQPTPVDGAAFTINLDSNPQGATITEVDGTVIGQTPTSVVLPSTTIVEFTLGGFDDNCRFELSNKLKDQTVKCTFRKLSAGGNPDAIKANTPPSSGPSPKKPVNEDSLPIKKTPSSSPSKKKPSSNPSR